MTAAIMALSRCTQAQPPLCTSPLQSVLCDLHNGTSQADLKSTSPNGLLAASLTAYQQPPNNLHCDYSGLASKPESRGAPLSFWSSQLLSLCREATVTYLSYYSGRSFAVWVPGPGSVDMAVTTLPDCQG
ncbi:hypothetical protein AAFF_G00236420 [Aldrovandia affinis]|uniref:Uncharacterized protein n=1 Tax=Aldrovandia affinis TaxID=143900 RepID=A0AAD7W3V6_9TELE|nr:hypothetical protein AAFF_G00236420 [Aldrovandia affinis]